MTIGRRTAIELLHLVGGIVIALVIAWVTAWAVPLARIDIWSVDFVSILIILVMGVQPVRAAVVADRADDQPALGGAIG